MENQFLDQMRELWDRAGRRYKEHEDIRNRRQNSLENRSDWRLIEDEARVATRLRRKGMDSAMAESLIDGARATPQLGNLLLERIIRESELLDVSFLRLGAMLSKSVARIQIRSSGGRVLGHGTGFLVSPRLMMTNNHVLQDAGVAGSARAQFDYVARSDDAQPITTDFEFDPQVFFKTNRTLDYTLVAVAHTGTGGAQLSDRPWSPLIRESGKALVGERVNIIQHPRGDTMKVALRDNRIVDRLENFLHYATDTERGSSGSKVCNDSWEIAALHHSGVPKMDDRGAILLDDGTRWDGSRSTMDRIDWVANEGVRISRIVEHLDGSSMTGSERALYEACFDPMPDSFPEARPVPGPKPDPYEELDGMLRKTESDGSVSWYFRVNFGPVGQVPSTLPQGGFPPPPPPPSPPSPINAKPDEARQRAEELLERFRPDLPYYDAQADKKDVEDYYAAVDLDASQAKLFDELSALVRDTHKEELSYKSARLKHLYPWVDLRENGDLRNIYSGTVLEPAEIIAQELERFELARPGFLTTLNAEFFGEEDLDEMELMLENSMPFNCE
ncbi:MAG: serine protease, partial [Pseudomonadota bacterium]